MSGVKPKKSSSWDEEREQAAVRETLQHEMFQPRFHKLFVSLFHKFLHNGHVIVIVELLSTQDIVLVFLILEGGCDARKAPLEMLVF